MSSWDWNTGGGDNAATTSFDDGNTGDNGFGFGSGDTNGGGFGGNEAGGDGGDNTCYNCGEPGHNKTECPNPKVFTGECRVCKKEGHMSKDCPDAGPRRCGNCRKEGHFIDECPEPLVCPRCSGSHKLKECPEPMKCRHCEGEHMAKDCPDYVPTCKNCGEPNHVAAECKNARKIDRSHLPDITGEEAWKMLEQAINERDMDEVKEKLQVYVKAQPDITFVDLEKALRSQGYGLYLIPLVKASLSITLCNMDLQGNLGKKYTVNYRFSDKPRRETEKEGWPKDHAEVLARLADAGDVVPLGQPKCTNCNKLGHISKNCDEEKMEPTERAVVKCYNCDEEGHRVRDCPIPRVDKFACKNCGKSGHKVADCTEPRSAEDVECRKCNEIGHFSKDCPKAGPRGCRNCGQEGHMAKECTEPRNMANVQCRNCDEYGHTGRDCPKPRDISRVKCQNCQEMGHFKSKCPNPHVTEDGGGGAGDPNWGADAGGADNNTGDAGGDSWGNENATNTVNAGGDTWGSSGGGVGGGGGW